MPDDTRRPPIPDSTRRSGDVSSWAGFLIVAFAVVGLVGALATYAAQIPFERALAREAAIDSAVAASTNVASSDADRASRVAALADSLGDSATALAGNQAGLAGRAAAEKSRMLQAFGREAEDFGMRLRIVIAAFTAAAALFGVAILSVVRKAR